MNTASVNNIHEDVNLGFWAALPVRAEGGFVVGAPMDDVTDVAFRTVIARHGKPHVMYTEFTSADGLIRAPAEGQRKLRAKLAFSEIERPIVAQLFTSNPQHMYEAAKLVAELGFDGLDINMGCPDKTVEKQGCGSDLIKHPEIARELIRAAKNGVSTGAQNGKIIPVSVKTRIGYNEESIDTWIPELLQEHPAVITIHARTRKEMSAVPAHWDVIPRVVALRDQISPQTLIVGNGDVPNVQNAREKVAQYGCDGVMIGRGMFGNPWYGTMHTPTPTERINALIEHIETFDKTLMGIKSFSVMKKHFGSYIVGWDHASELRKHLMETNDPEEALSLLRPHS